MRALDSSFLPRAINTNIELTAVIGNDLDKSGGKCSINDINQCATGKYYQVNIWNNILSAADVWGIFRHQFCNQNALIKWDEFRQANQTGSFLEEGSPF